MERQVGKMMIYCCGGTGINIGKYFTTYREKEGLSSGFAKMQAVFIDTSKSNLSSEINQDELYVLEGLDGSGKIRAENYREISESVHDILMKYPPGDINIVLSSGGGGSGSVIAPALTSELIKREKSTIVAMVSSTDSRIEIENSVKTLKSYEAIAKLRETPVVMLHYQNSSETSRSSVNTELQEDVVRLAALFSRQNKELDSADLRNWLIYTRVSKNEPRLVFLDMKDGQNNRIESNRAHILTVATLAYEGMPTNIGSPVDYQCVGYIAPENEGSIKLSGPSNYLILDGMIGDVYNKLAEALAAIDEQNLAKKRTTKSLVDENDKIHGDGMVL